MKTQRLLREYFSVVLEEEINLKQLSQLVSTIPVSVDTKSVFAFTLSISVEAASEHLSGEFGSCIISKISYMNFV